MPHDWRYATTGTDPDAAPPAAVGGRPLARLVAVCGRCGEIRHRDLVAGIQKSINLSGACVTELAAA